ncbi:DsbA family protein [Desulfobacter latus]|uniref:Thioredoxin domain-containing protein n=1 Tax=Desulfobacter latus TaxID=2292 RepID=A0A850TCW3_9BACT|nr:thioredoxin domain-containing protein [Desulfobacter latus]NWH05246.1 thioredoxin domain-containing protein [Desulfobacter latus]
MFVLTKQGTVEIYSLTGFLEESLPLNFPADLISSAGRGDILFLTDSNTGNIRIVQLDFIQNINIQGAPIRGPEDAQVAVVIFTDFQCVFCDNARILLDQVTEAYPNQVKIVYKNFPLSMHNFARQAAAAAMAAQKQGKFWPMHDLLFDNSKILSEEKLKEFALTLKLDMEKFNSDMMSTSLNRQIKNDIIDGRKAGVQGTPTIFINGRLMKRRGLAEIKKMIDAELKVQ